MVNAEFSKGVWEPLTDSGLSLLEVRDVLAVANGCLHRIRHVV